MKRYSGLIAVGCLFLILSSNAGFAQRRSNEPYVVNNNGQKIFGHRIEASNGTIILHKGNAEVQFRKGEYERAFIPQPEGVKRLRQSFEQADYDRVVEEAEYLFSQYKYLGWAGRIAYMHGQALIEQEAFQDALTVLKQATQYPMDDAQKYKLNKAQAECYLELGENKQASRLLQELKKAEDEEIALFSFYANGKLLREQGKENEAIIEFLKVVMLFDNEQDQAEPYYSQSKKAAVELLKKINDKSYERIQEQY
jgi:tetratricopeptide (TPR) repeat protein